MSTSEDMGFLSRWARRKSDARRGIAPPSDSPLATPPGASAAAPVAEPVPTSPRVTQGTSAGAATVPAGDAAAVSPPTLEDVAESDYARFVAGDVDPGVRNAAMKKLFTDPHFNVMDGLDTYIDDYGIPDPCRRACCGSWRSPASWACSTEDAPMATPWGARRPGRAYFQSITKPQATTDEDPDLRLQPDDAAGPEPGRIAQALAKTPGASADGLDTVHTPAVPARGRQRSSVRPRPPPRSGEPLLVACTQEQRLFLSLNDRPRALPRWPSGRSASSTCARPAAGRGCRCQATPKLAALIAAAQLPAPSRWAP
jgi:hypothetical protein